jgi:hypothetical protein
MAIKDIFQRPFILVKGKFTREAKMRIGIVGGIAILGVLSSLSFHSSDLWKGREYFKEQSGVITENKGDPIGFDDIRRQMSVASAEISKNYGDKGLVIILPSDPKADYFRVNFKNELDERYPKYDHGDGVGELASHLNLTTLLGHQMTGLSKEDLDVLIDRSHFVSPNGTTANIVRVENGDHRLVFMRPESPTNFTRSEKRNVPFDIDFDTLNEWGFFHEMTHARDVVLNIRDYEDTTKLYGVNIGNDAGVLIGEAVADVGAGMIALKATGNTDTFQYLIKPMRYALGSDKLHQTQHIAISVMANVSLDDVKNKSDAELMTMAQQRVDSFVTSDLEGYKKEAPGSKATDVVDYLRGLRGSDANKTNNAMAIESSIQHLTYQGKMSENRKDLIKVIEKHIEKYDDMKMKSALGVAKLRGSEESQGFDVKAFSSEMKFSVDWSAHDRQAVNSEKLKSYYLEKTSNRLGFDANSIAPNVAGAHAQILNEKSQALKQKTSDFNLR